jgi:hypothetical protein
MNENEALRFSKGRIINDNIIRKEEEKQEEDQRLAFEREIANKLQ